MTPRHHCLKTRRFGKMASRGIRRLQSVGCFRLCIPTSASETSGLGLPLRETYMTRWLSWVSDRKLTGWTCSQCGWTFPIPSMLSDPDAKKAYDRLASAKFQEHKCAEHGKRPDFGGEESFAERARKLVMRGFKPKDAVEIVLQEITLEHRNDAAKMEKARIDADEFMHRVKTGLI